MNRRIVYFNITYMKYYRGITDEDQPRNGGSYVENESDAYEKYNFLCGEDGITRGFVETKHRKGYKDYSHVPNKLHIENIDPDYKKAESIDNVLVIFTATGKNGRVIVGWYENATVYRNRRHYEVAEENLEYNVSARNENCYLIPEQLRAFKVPQAKNGVFGIGQANIRYVKNERDLEFTKKAIEYLNGIKHCL